jgi:hypothetical protein
MPPTVLDTAERFLGRAVVIGLILLVIAIGAGAWLSKRQQPTPLPPTATAPNTDLIELTIDFGDHSERRFTSLSFSPGMTVADALLAAGKHPHPVSVESSGSGDTFFVSAIDGLRNQGGGNQARNWQFFVNDAPATRGAGATTLRPGDRVRWVFDVLSSSPQPSKP